MDRCQLAEEEDKTPAGVSVQPGEGLPAAEDTL